MRTRRSPRNQQILWKALGGAPEPKPQPVKLTEAEIRAMWWLSKTSRNAMLRALGVLEIAVERGS